MIEVVTSILINVQLGLGIGYVETSSLNKDIGCNAIVCFVYEVSIFDLI